MRILVTGGAGFVGTNLIKQLLKEGHVVISIDNYSSSSKKNVLRGIHLQTKFSQQKYVSVLKGAILDVAVYLRKNSMLIIE